MKTSLPEYLTKEELDIIDSFEMKKAIVRVDLDRGVITLTFWEGNKYPSISLFNAPVEVLTKVAAWLNAGNQLTVICRYNRESGNLLFFILLDYQQEPAWVGTLDTEFTTHYEKGHRPYARFGITMSPNKQIWLTAYPIIV